jgi:dolichol-phosphate mannosyltransferase
VTGASIPRLSVVAPVWNEEECIDDFVRETCRTLDVLPGVYELICVDDGSTDSSQQILVGLRASHPSLRVLALRNHAGKSAAWLAGVHAARANVIAFIDADLQNDPSDIGHLVQLLLDGKGADCVSGRRVHRRDSWLRRLSSRIGNGVRRALTDSAIHDSASGLKVCRAEALRGIVPFDGMHRFLPTLIGLNGGSVVEAEVNHRPRRRGSAKYGMRRAPRGLVDTLVIRWLQRRWVRGSADEL